MAIFQQKSEAERAAEQQVKAVRQQAAQAARDAERQAKEQEKARQAYLASPVGQAEAAYQSGQMFFQFTCDITKIQGKSSDFGLAPYWQSTKVTQHRATDVLGQIEEAGWRLEHFQTEFIETGEVSRQKVMSSGSVSRTTGFVQGIYLFRRR